MTQRKSFDVWRSRLVAFAFLMVVPTLASAATIIPSRPRLYFTQDQLPELRQRIAGSHKLYWDTLTNWPKPDAGNYATLSGRDLDKTHFYIERNAFMYLMLADSDPVKANQHANIARNWLMELTVFNFTQGPNEAFEILWAMAIGYDWLYNWPGLSDVDKQKIRNVLVSRTDIHFDRTGVQGFSDPLIGPSPSSAFVKSIFDNQVTENNLGVFFPGLALYEGDDRFGLNVKAQKYVDGALARIELAAEALDKYAPNGGFWEGQSYYAARLQGDVYMIYAWKAATGEDLFEEERTSATRPATGPTASGRTAPPAGRATSPAPPRAAPATASSPRSWPTATRTGTRSGTPTSRAPSATPATRSRTSRSTGTTSSSTTPTCRRSRPRRSRFTPSSTSAAS